MRSSASESIVDFIAHLLPLYIGEERDGVTCARSLADGTLIVPKKDELEEGFVEIQWQGDSSRVTTVQGTFVASLAVARYVEFNAIANSKATKPELKHLSEHFTVKTGESLIISVETDSELYKWVGRVTERIGTQAAIEILKKAAGF